MSKKPAFNGIDYTPRKPEAIAAAGERPKDRHIHGVVQHQQRYPIFEVIAGGKTIDWTSIRTSAHAAFHAAGVLPKQLLLVHADGRKVLLNEVSATGREAQQLAMAA